MDRNVIGISSICSIFKCKKNLLVAPYFLCNLQEECVCMCIENSYLPCCIKI